MLAWLEARVSRIARTSRVPPAETGLREDLKLFDDHSSSAGAFERSWLGPDSLGVEGRYLPRDPS